MTDDRIAAIRERCEAIQIITPNQARKDLIQAKKDMAELLTEIDRLNSELFGKTEQLEAAKSELLQKTQQLASYQQVKIACNDAGFNDFEALLMGYQQVKSDLADAIESCDISDAANTALDGALAASQRREQAAVENFTSAARNGNILCEFCAADCVSAEDDTGGNTCQCGCFEWRGVSEKGASHE